MYLNDMFFGISRIEYIAYEQHMCFDVSCVCYENYCLRQRSIVVE